MGSRKPDVVGALAAAGRGECMSGSTARSEPEAWR